MRSLTFLLIIFGIALISCTKKEQSCQDLEMKENHSGICTADCPGVTGCDGKFYCNECEANANGITID